MLPSDGILNFPGKKTPGSLPVFLKLWGGCGFNKIIESTGRLRANLLSHGFKEMNKLWISPPEGSMAVAI